MSKAIVHSDLATALDPRRLFHAAGLEPDPWQSELLLSPWQRALLLCSRQSGKSTVTAAIGLHTALYTPESLTLLLAPAQRQSKELFAKVWAFYRDIGQPVPVEAKSALRAEFANGSRIISLPGSERTIRGFSGVDCLIIDEAARVEDQLYEAVRPMLGVSGGRLMALTTPAGQRGFFYNAWSDPGQQWHRVKVTAEECPHLSEEFLAQKRRELGQWLYQQEYQCRFVDNVNQLFATRDIDAAFDPDVKPLFQSEASSGDGAPVDSTDETIEPLFEA